MRPVLTTARLPERLGPWGRVRRPVRAMLTFLGVPGMSARIFRPNGAIVLMYHSVARPAKAKWIDPANHVPADVFEQQMRFLTRNRRVLSLQAIINVLREGDVPPPGTVAITFDDGYLDNLEVAAPMLDSLGLTATLFLATGYVTRGETQWIDQVYSAFAHRTNQTLIWPNAAGEHHWLDTRGGADAAYRLVCATLMSADVTTRHALLAHLRSALAPTLEPPRLTLTWSDVRRLLREHRCFDLGVHTVDHIDLIACGESGASAEIVRALDDMAREAGLRPRLFSFPYGRSSPRLREIVKDAGFEIACGGGASPLLGGGSDPLGISRVSAPRTMEHFSFLTSSANSGLLHRCMR